MHCLPPSFLAFALPFTAVSVRFLPFPPRRLGGMVAFTTNATGLMAANAAELGPWAAGGPVNGYSGGRRTAFPACFHCINAKGTAANEALPFPCASTAPTRRALLFF